jgi:hypothetical protein
MKKWIILCLMVLLCRFAGGCFLIPAQTYDGSEKAYQMHPEWTSNTPSYFDGEDPDDGN